MLDQRELAVAKVSFCWHNARVSVLGRWLGPPLALNVPSTQRASHPDRLRAGSVEALTYDTPVAPQPPDACDLVVNVALIIVI